MENQTPSSSIASRVLPRAVELWYSWFYQAMSPLGLGLFAGIASGATIASLVAGAFYAQSTAVWIGVGVTALLVIVAAYGSLKRESRARRS
jgi:hypothetical protein